VALTERKATLQNVKIAGEQGSENQTSRAKLMRINVGRGCVHAVPMANVKRYDAAGSIEARAEIAISRSRRNGNPRSQGKKGKTKKKQT